jgi:putative membrane protein
VFWNIIIQILSGVIGLFLAQKYIDGVIFAGKTFFIPENIEQLRAFTKTLVFVGIILGLLNHFVKPILNAITLPLRIITFNLFSIAVGLFIVWLVDLFSLELRIEGLKPLFLTTLLIWVISFILSNWFIASKKK